jgi:hypothetical protein
MELRLFLRTFFWISFPHLLFCVIAYRHFQGASGGDIAFRFCCMLSLSVYIILLSVLILWKFKKKKTGFLSLLLLIILEFVLVFTM